MKFCCQNMLSDTLNGSIIFYKNKLEVIIKYYPRDRQYNMMYNNTDGYQILFCPFCGKYLGESLSDEWWATLEKEYNITDPIVDDREKVPPEFWTDEWWKKRGL